MASSLSEEVFVEIVDAVLKEKFAEIKSLSAEQIQRNIIQIAVICALLFSQRDVLMSNMSTCNVEL